MTTIPYSKLHGAQNDFLYTRAAQIVVPETEWPQLAQAICHRHTGPGADGWYVVSPDEEADAAIRLYNADGGIAEVSGNGTRCCAHWLRHEGAATGVEVRIRTGAGVKTLRLLEEHGLETRWEMAMGLPKWREDEIRTTLNLQAGPLEATLVDVGNPQCALFVEEFPSGWQQTGAELERHSRFPNRTNVSFVRVLDRSRIEVRIFERGVGETMSSGTGCTGAALAAILRGVAESPVDVLTPAGPLTVRWSEDNVYLTGPSALVGEGEFFYRAE